MNCRAVNSAFSPAPGGDTASNTVEDFARPAAGGMTQTGRQTISWTNSGLRGPHLFVGGWPETSGSLSDPFLTRVV